MKEELMTCTTCDSDYNTIKLFEKIGNGIQPKKHSKLMVYKRQIITLKPGRWNCFFVMSFSVAGLLILVFSVLVLFLNLPLVSLLVFAFLMRILVISGRIFKIKTTLFKNQSSNSGFIMYLCAFEIAPVLIEFVLLRNFLV